MNPPSSSKSTLIGAFSPLPFYTILIDTELPLPNWFSLQCRFQLAPPCLLQQPPPLKSPPSDLIRQAIYYKLTSLSNMAAVTVKGLCAEQKEVKGVRNRNAFNLALSTSSAYVAGINTTSLMF